MAMMKRVAESAVRAFALNSASPALTRHLHVSFFFSLSVFPTDPVDRFFDG